MEAVLSGEALVRGLPLDRQFIPLVAGHRSLGLCLSRVTCPLFLFCPVGFLTSVR